jgi:hypothetical protein
VIGLDQTGWPNLGQRGAKKWQMWALTSPGAVYHTIRDDKSAETFLDLVGAFEGTIVCDALGTHSAGAREGPGIELAGCWAHIRRRFGEAGAELPRGAADARPHPRAVRHRRPSAGRRPPRRAAPDRLA